MDIHAFWDAVIRQDAQAIRPFFAPDAVIRWHCSNECFTVEEYIRANCEYPGEWLGEIERVISMEDQTILAAHVHAKDDSLSCHVVSFLTLTEGKIITLDEYWGDDSPPPQWRQDMSIGSKIK